MKKVVLVVDDDPVARNIIETMLSTHFQVCCLKNRLELLEKLNDLQRKTISIHSVLIDLFLEDSSGADLYVELKSNKPLAQRLVILTAMPREEVSSEFPQLCEARLLQKPFQQHELLEALSTIE